MPGEHLDLSSDPSGTVPIFVSAKMGLSPSPGASIDNPRKPDSRRYVGIHFVCCNVYSRVYINRDETAYDGNCPKCAKRVRLQIDPGGTDARFFTAG